MHLSVDKHQKPNMPCPPNPEVLRRAKAVRNLRTDRDYTTFCASSSLDSGNYLLSNFSAAPFKIVWPMEEAVPLHLRGKRCRYDTSEHAYQSLKTLDRESAQQFETGGRVSMNIFKNWPGKGDIYADKMKYWGSKGPGISAKMVSNLAPSVARKAFGISLSPKEGRSGKLSEELKVWGPILTRKFFSNSDARCILIGTKKDLLVEKSRRPNVADYWCGYYKSGEVVGKNMMGRILMHIRAEIAGELA
jgi:predicted NAD-dependent protein-ADP-ribosyltransferase YbiA (DUF1768 family)